MWYPQTNQESKMEKMIMLDPADYVGVRFWIISAAMVAATPDASLVEERGFADLSARILL